MDLLQSLLSNLWSVLLIVIFFGGSIFVHELGHFIAARRRGMVVERFSIGFGPKIFSWRGKDGVEYRLSWLPLGGYVALPQLADMRGIEGESTADVKALPAPTYATKMIVAGAGVVCNVIFAFVLACIVWIAGQPTTYSLNTTQIGEVLPTIKPVDGPEVRSPASEAGLQAGDIIKAVDGKSVNNWMSFTQTLATGSEREADGRRTALLTIERAGRLMDTVIHPRLSGEEGLRTIGVEPADDMSVAKVLPNSPAASANILSGDKLMAVDGQPVFQREALYKRLQASEGRPIVLEIERDSRLLQINLAPQLRAIPGSPAGAYFIGVEYRNDLIVIHPSPFRQLFDDATSVWRVRGALFSPKSDVGFSKLSGPIGIARGFHSLAQVDIRLVLWFTILINVNLAILNLLPIPVLDGGHMLFATIAKLRGRALPAQLIATTQSVFMVLLFSLMMYVLYFDSRRWIRDSHAAKPEAEAVAPAKP
ncbi:MAG: RIP metalloprotease RseP [Verrucomicrobia bacterium]|nr:RIP metalloprotease RseP [Verrucomicrobiota bacterium]